MTTTAPAEPGVRRTEARAAFAGLCAAGFLAYCSYAICRSPVLPLFARHLGAGPELVFASHGSAKEAAVENLSIG